MGYTRGGGDMRTRPCGTRARAMHAYGTRAWPPWAMYGYEPRGARHGGGRARARRVRVRVHGWVRVRVHSNLFESQTLSESRARAWMGACRGAWMGAYTIHTQSESPDGCMQRCMDGRIYHTQRSLPLALSGSESEARWHINQEFQHTLDQMP